MTPAEIHDFRTSTPEMAEHFRRRCLRVIDLPMDERELIEANLLASLRESGGNKTHAAKLIGVDVTTVRNRMRDR